MSETKSQRRGLGRGLSALMADLEIAPSGETTSEKPTERQQVPVAQIEPNPDQPRRDFDPEALQELADSIKARGVLQPLILRPHPERSDCYQIVAGERRWRAAQQAGLYQVPAIIRSMSDSEMFEIAIIENIQRADLNAIEEAASFKQLIDRFGHTQERLAEGLNKSRSHIANLIRLLTLPPEVQDFVKSGQLSAGHARALVPTSNAAELALRVIECGLSVRETEALVRRQQEQPKKDKTKEKIRTEEDDDTHALEADLSAHLDMKVEIKHSGKGGGKLILSYKDLDQLDRLFQLFYR